jgi:glyoxylase-like metal-dependent hydrolase (beta-lactamase superfamily II)
VDVQELAPGLWRWTATHGEWDDPVLGSEVGCVYVETDDALALIDPLVPEEDRDRFFAALDRDVERLGLPVAIALTCAWHARSSAELRERYGATDEVPDGVVALPVVDDESVFWIPRQRALVAGDALLGVNGLQRCPDDWVAERGREGFLPALRALLALEPELVLPSHGAPVLHDGRRALAEAIDGPAFGE